MGRFGNDSKAFFSRVYESEVPWEVGRIQPDLLGLITAYPPVGKILDIGCGSGDTTIDIARLGYEVIGIDFVENAIRTANSKLDKIKEKEHLNVSFVCGNGLTPSKYGKDYGAIVDSGFMHLFDDPELIDYFKDLHTALVVGGKIYLAEFSYEFDIPNAPRAITREKIQDSFSNDKWEILAIREGSFINKVSPVPAIIACMQKKI